MSVVKINVLTVPRERREVLEQRFAARAGDVEGAAGFERFQLLRPTDDSDEYFVVTQWESEEAFAAWLESRSFARSHDADRGDTDEQAGGQADTQGGRPRDGDGGGDRPAASDATLRSFEVLQEV